jgi:hypothetical protein
MPGGAVDNLMRRRTAIRSTIRLARWGAHTIIPTIRKMDAQNLRDHSPFSAMLYARYSAFRDADHRKLMVDLDLLKDTSRSHDRRPYDVPLSWTDPDRNFQNSRSPDLGVVSPKWSHVSGEFRMRVGA